MVTLKVGLKGTGKTKMLVDEVHEAAKASKGLVVCIEYGGKLTYHIRTSARLIDAKDYDIKDANTLYGFVCGTLACNYDITEIFVDSALKICGDDVAAFEEFMYKLDDISAKMGVDCFITSSIAEENLPEGLTKFLAVEANEEN